MSVSVNVKASVSSGMYNIFLSLRMAWIGRNFQGHILIRFYRI